MTMVSHLMYLMHLSHVFLNCLLSIMLGLYWVYCGPYYLSFPLVSVAMESLVTMVTRFAHLLPLLQQVGTVIDTCLLPIATVRVSTRLPCLLPLATSRDRFWS